MKKNKKNIVLTDEEEALILRMRENKEEEAEKITKVGNLKYDMISPERFLEGVRRACQDYDLISRNDLKKILTQELSDINAHWLKRGTSFYCTLWCGFEFWENPLQIIQVGHDLTSKWGEENLKNIRPFKEKLRNQYLVACV
jgi:hypothetical protein